MNRNLRDGLNFMSKLTPGRAWNAVQVLSSYYYSRITGSPVPVGMPISISFEPTTSCNLRCPECPSGLRSFTRPTGMLELLLYKKVLDELSSKLLYLILYFQGEPYLHPQFFELVQYAAKKIIEGARNIVKWKKELKSSTPHVIFQFLVVKHNQHQIQELKQLAKEIGVDEVGLKTAQVYEYEEGNELIPDIDKYSRYKKTSEGKWEVKHSLDNHCWKMWHSCVVTWDGKVVPCCFDKDAHHSMGELSKHSFSNVWKSEPYMQFRSSLLRSRSEIEMCKNCTEGAQVWG